MNDLPRQKRGSILTDEMRQFIDDQMKNDDELTSTKLKEMIEEKWPQVKVSTTTIKREKRKLNWVCTRPHYCQLLREVLSSYVGFKQLLYKFFTDESEKKINMV